MSDERQEVVQVVKEEKISPMKEKFGIFGLATFFYAVLYVFCMYQNKSGITYPFFVAGSLYYFYYCFGKLGLTWKKGNLFYLISIGLLAVATICTDDAVLHFFNKTGIFLLMITLLLGNLYDVKAWSFGKMVKGITGTVFSAFCEIFTPFTHGKWYCKNKLSAKNSKMLYVALGVVVAIPIFAMMAGLLFSADAVFRVLGRNVLDALNLENIYGILWRFVLFFMAAYGLVVYLEKRNLKVEEKPRKIGEALLAIPVALMLTLMYMVFCGIQVRYLFVGGVILPEGYTYAEYAREGFFQLLMVAMINFVLVLVGLAYFNESKVLKAILTMMSLCSFVMIASSAYRMIMYISFYYLTYLRVLVLWGLLVLTLLFVGVIGFIFRKGFPLFRYSLVVVTVFYIGLAFARPQYLIAKVNVAAMNGQSSFFKSEEFDDYYYLTGLCADAAPVIVPYLKENGYDLNWYYKDSNIWEEFGDYYWGDKEVFGYHYLYNIKERCQETTFRKFNFSRFYADFLILSETTAGF